MRSTFQRNTSKRSRAARTMSVSAVGLAVALTLLFSAGESMAGSGKHKEISIMHCTNLHINTELKFSIDSFNGDDKCGQIAHGGDTIAKGRTGTVRCHGKGKHRCFIAVRDNPKQITVPCEKIDLDKGRRLLLYSPSRKSMMTDGEPAWIQTEDMDAECELGRRIQH